MKISFIYLPHVYLRQPDAQAPLGLLYLASVVDKKHEVKIANLTSNSVSNAIQSLEYSDAYGITATCLEIPLANEFACKIKEKFANSKVILGGPGTVAPEFVNFDYIDSVCIGEGENVINEILEDVECGSLKKFYKGTQVNIENLFPAREYLKFQGGNIFAYGKKYSEGQSTIILTSRGCPYKCSFCSAPSLSYGKTRLRSAPSIKKEIEKVISLLGIRQFRISDDLFISNRKRVLEICDSIGPLDIFWRISTRVKPIDEELLTVMRSAGCVEISFGVESFDDDVLGYLNKGVNAADNVSALELANKVGIKTRALMMIRTPGQTENTVPINISYLENTPYDIVCCTTFVPLPGSDIWNHPDKYNIKIVNKNLEDYNFYFFDRNGDVELKKIISFNDRDDSIVDEETLIFKEYLKETNKLNVG